MKTLYLLRHAKSDQAKPDLDDRDRPLNKRGKHDCLLMADTIAEPFGSIDHVFCSPAKRARATLKHIRRALNTPLGAMTLDEALYTFEEGGLLEWLKQRDNSLNSLLITGHNPALANLIAILTGQPPVHFPTCAYAKIQLRIEYWDQTRPNCGELVHFLTPRHFHQS